jgi:hypothetical protein
VRQRIARRAAIQRAAPDPVLALRARVEHATLTAVRRYTPGFLVGRVTLVLPSREWLRREGAPLRWRSVARDVEEHFGPAGCDGANMLGAPYAPAFAELFAERRVTKNPSVR